MTDLTQPGSYGTLTEPATLKIERLLPGATAGPLDFGGHVGLASRVTTEPTAGPPTMIAVRFGQKPDWEPAISRALDTRRYTPQFGPPGGEGPAPDLFVPLCLDDYRRLAGLPQAARPLCLAPAPTTVALCDDKLEFNRFLIAEGFGAHVPPIIAAPPRHFPVHLKARHGEWGVGVTAIADQAAYEAAAHALATGRAFLQADVPGRTEYALHALAQDGRLLWHGLMQYEMAPAPAGSAPDRVAYVKDRDCPPRTSRFTRTCEHIGLFSAILARLRYTGTACIDFKLTAAGPMIFELNPRPGSSLMGFVTEWLDAQMDALGQPRDHIA